MSKEIDFEKYELVDYLVLLLQIINQIGPKQVESIFNAAKEAYENINK